MIFVDKRGKVSLPRDALGRMRVSGDKRMLINPVRNVKM